ncbi:MAG: murein biosynthesis integral membrane protein MurJ [Candidatus Dasytiphilus stammeri]
MKSSRNLLKSLACVSTITCISRILGFVRDSIIAAVFGVGVETDAFFVAFKLPNLLRRIFAEGAFSQAFIPILAEYKNKRSKTSTQLLIAGISGMLILVLTIISIYGVLTAPWIILVTAPGFTHSYDKFVLTSSLLRITFSYIFLISLTSMASAILNMWNFFAIPAFAPALLNISMIISALYISPYFNRPILALAGSVLIGGILQLIYQLPFLKKIEMLVLPRINLYDIGVWRVLKKMVPAVIGVSANQLSFIINTIFASFLVSGSISWMYYADRVMEFPLGVLGVTLSTILLPYLTKKYHTHYDNHEYSILLDRALRICLLMAVPSAVALGVLAQPLIIVLFQYRKFTAFDTFMTQQILVYYAAGLIGIMLVKVLVTAFYSHQDIRTPVKIAIVTLIISQLINFLFLGSLKQIGLSLSVSISACLNSSLLYWKLKKKKYYIPQPGWGIFLLRLIIAVIIMGLALLLIINIMPNWQNGIMIMRLLRMIAVILIGALIYFITLLLLGFRLKDLSLHLTK